jgi:hypothetical protein
VAITVFSYWLWLSTSLWPQFCGFELWKSQHWHCIHHWLWQCSFSTFAAQLLIQLTEYAALCMYGIGMVYLGQLQNGMSQCFVIFTTAMVMQIVPKCPSQSGYQIGTKSKLLHVRWCMGHDVFSPLLGSDTSAIS